MKNSEYTLTATSISKAINCRRDVVNRALIKIGFLRRDDIGFFSLNIAGETLEGKEGSTYVKWHESILSNKLFLDAANLIQDEIKSTSFEKKSKDGESDKKEPSKKEEKKAPKKGNVSSKKEEPKKKETLTATKVGEALGFSSKEVNAALTSIGFIKKSEEGYELIKEDLGEQKKFEKTPFVAWYPSILKNEVFLSSLKKEDKPAPILPVKKVAVAPVKDKKKVFKFDRKQFDAEYRTQSGHDVRSRGEVIVADWLYSHFFSFSYEKRLPIVEELYSDFFLNKEKLYIEVWGLESTKYLDRKEKKIKMYAENGYKMIGLDDNDIKNIDDFLPLKLAELGFKID